MRLIYIAGQYNNDTFAGIDRNIKIADALGQEIVKRFGQQGVFVIIPHNNTPLHWKGIQSDEWFYEATLSLLRKCDACVVVPGSEKTSIGTQGEIKYCQENEVPYFMGDQVGLRLFKAWLNRMRLD